MSNGNHFIETLQNDWAIITAILILAILQGYKIWIDSRNAADRTRLDGRMENTLNNIELYLKILSDKYTEEVTDIQMPIIVHEFVGHIKESIMSEASFSITRNDIKNNKKEVQAKLEVFICNRFRELYTNLGRFKWKGCYLSEFIDLTLKDKVIENVLEIVLKERDTRDQVLMAHQNLESAVRQRFDEIKNDIKTRAYG